jgi:hypothetical protein
VAQRNTPCFGWKAYVALLRQIQGFLFGFVPSDGKHEDLIKGGVVAGYVLIVLFAFILCGSIIEYSVDSLDNITNSSNSVAFYHFTYGEDGVRELLHL